MNDEMKEFDLTCNTNVVLASIDDLDLMRIKCYAVHEGENENGVVFPRNILLASYKSLIDKRVVIVPDKYGFPVGHGYDFKKHTFNEDKRKTIGHVCNAYPVIVTSDEQIIDLSELVKTDIEGKSFPDGQLRIIAELVIDKFYFSEIAENLKYLHKINDLFFSMESLTAQKQLDNGTRECSVIKFTGLAIVSNPAFVNAKSIEIAQKEEKHVDYEKMYNELKAKYDELLKKVNGDSSKKTEEDKKKKELAEKLVEQSTQIVDLKAELASAKEENLKLTQYKEKFEVAEKEKTTVTRAEKLKKLHIKADTEKFKDLSDVEFAEFIIDEVDKVDTEDIEVSEAHYESHGKKSYVSDLIKGLNALIKEDE